MFKHYKLILFFVNSIFLILSHQFNVDKILVIFLLFINALIIMELRSNIPLFIFSIFISFYSISLIPYYFLNFNISFFDSFNNVESYRQALQVQSIFLSSLYLFLKPKLLHVDYKISLVLSYSRSNLLFAIFFIICLIILLKGMSGDNLFVSGQYSGDAVVKSTFYEYFILFYLIAYYYSSREGFQKFLLYLLFFSYCFKTLLFGGRIEVIQLTVLMFLLVTVNNNIKVSPVYVFLTLILFYYLNVIISNVRNNPELLLSFDFVNIFNPYSFINSDNQIIYSNEGEVFQSSARLIGLVDKGVITYFDRLISFFSFVISFFVPTNLLPLSASLISFKQEEFTSGGGGLISSYFYVWFDFLGPIMIGFWIVFLFSKINKAKYDYLKLYGYMMFSTFPRWYAYNPLILFKLCFWVIPIVLVANSFRKILK